MAIIRDDRQVWMDLCETLPWGTRYAPAPLPELPAAPLRPSPAQHDADLRRMLRGTRDGTMPRAEADAIWAEHDTQCDEIGQSIIDALVAGARAQAGA